MSQSDSARPVPDNLEQQRKRAKDLLRAARAGDPDARSRIGAHHAGTASLKLADAQLTIAREAGFPSWPKLVEFFRHREGQAFHAALSAGDAQNVRRMLAASSFLRSMINKPVFAFGQRAAHMVASNPTLLDVLMSFGADVNLKSDWSNGPFAVIDNADEAGARFLIERGARLSPNVAARLGWFDELRRIVDADPSLVHERGGDGQQPLHLAKTVEIADYLLDRGAEIDARCIDHKSTPAQYALVERTDVCRQLLARGAAPDIFMAAHLGDVELTTRLLDADPACAAARINKPGYAPVPELHIYCWTLGFDRSPHEVALGRGHRAVYELLLARSASKVRFLDAALRADESAARDALRADPTLAASLTAEESSALAHAIFHGRFAAAELMLALGFDVMARGQDGGTALHMACWMGNPNMVERLLERGASIEDRDPTHGSTPVGWAVFGSVHRCARGSDYPAVIDRLVRAGARVDVPLNKNGDTLLGAVDPGSAVAETLRRHGARK